METLVALLLECYMLIELLKSGLAEAVKKIEELQKRLEAAENSNKYLEQKAASLEHGRLRNSIRAETFYNAWEDSITNQKLLFGNNGVLRQRLEIAINGLDDMRDDPDSAQDIYDSTMIALEALDEYRVI